MMDANLSTPQCSAHRKTGDRCKKLAIKGGTVCRVHGGAAPQVKQKAQERLAAMVPAALQRLSELMQQKRDMKVALGATKDVLDRNDLTGKVKVEQSGQVTLTVERVIVQAPRLEEGE